MCYTQGMGSTASASATPIGTTIVSRNPATGEPIGEVPVMDAEEVRAAVARARAAQKEWGRLPVEERARRVLAFRDEIVTRAAALITRWVSIASERSASSRRRPRMAPDAPLMPTTRRRGVSAIALAAGYPA